MLTYHGQEVDYHLLTYLTSKLTNSIPGNDRNIKDYPTGLPSDMYVYNVYLHRASVFFFFLIFIY